MCISIGASEFPFCRHLIIFDFRIFYTHVMQMIWMNESCAFCLMISRIVVSQHTHSGSASMRWASLNDCEQIAYKTCAFESEYPNFTFFTSFHVSFFTFCIRNFTHDLNECFHSRTLNDLTHRYFTTHAFRKRTDALSKSEWNTND